MVDPRGRPLIGVTGPRRQGLRAWWFTRRALRRAGGRALWLRPGADLPPESLDGIIIGGGDDIDPVLYSQPSQVHRVYDAERDAFELQMIDISLRRPGFPVLGICRGAQLLNVFLGGSLFQELRSKRQLTSNRRTILPLKTLHLESASRLAEIMGCRRCKVNSLHNQAIADLGRGLRVAGRDLDRIVQAVEGEGADRLLLGVQWHPEFLPLMPSQQRLFRRLVEAASQHRHPLR